MRIIRTISLAALVAVPFVASAADLGAANSFNALVFGDFKTTKFVDIEGRLAVGKDLNPGNINAVNGFTINDHNVAGNYGLVVGGKTNLNGSQVHGNAFSGGDFVYKAPTMMGGVNGNAAVSFYGDGSLTGNVTYGTTVFYEKSYLANGHTTTQGTTPAPVDFAAAKTDLLAKSVYWGGLATTGSKTLNGNNILLSGSVSGLNVFSITATELASSTDFQVNISGSNATVLINVFGTAASMPSHAYSLSGIGVNKVLYNFVDATSLSTGQIQIDGSVLAPKAAVTGSDGQMNGTLVAASFTSGMELHDHLFTGNLPVAPVPEPGTWAALGLGALAMLRRRKK